MGATTQGDGPRDEGPARGMDEAEARAAKAAAEEWARAELERRVSPVAVASGDGSPLALGLAPRPDGSFALAVRYRLGIPSVRSMARKVADEVGPAVDVRRTGRIHPLARRIGPPVATAQAVGETRRVRPLRPGVSIAHVHVTAGTLGAFVRVGGRLHVLSNYHVLAGSPLARVGDVVVQPGPADGGRVPDDRVGTLAATVPLHPGRPARVDAAIALLDDDEVDATYPVGRVTTTAVATGTELVGKIGRTTGVTAGRITAIEMDDVVVGYGDELGDLAFDGQIEVESTGSGPFSRGGDSGSLVYRQDGVAIGLLFAGSETGGKNGSGLTYVNPIDAVLGALDAHLLG